MLRVGIVGAGNMGALHATLVKRRSEVEFVGFTDVDTMRAQLRCVEFGGKAYSNVIDMLEAGVDLVFVTVPNTKHREVVMTCLAAGVKVFCEKPFVTELADADAIMDQLAGQNDRLYVGFNRRFAPVYAKAKRIVSQGFRPFSGNIIMNDGDMTNPAWVTNVELTGGFLYDTTIHMFDMVRFLMGEIAEVRAVAQQCLYPLQDNFSMQFTTTAGQTVVLSSNGHASWLWPSERVQLWGDHATIVTEELDRVAYCAADSQPVEETNVKNFDKNTKWGYVQMHDDLFGALLEGKAPSVTAEDGYKSVLITDACYRSAASGGQIIKL